MLVREPTRPCLPSGGGASSSLGLDFAPDSSRSGGAAAGIRAVGDGAGNAHLTLSTTTGEAATGLVERVRVLSNGNVGIGTTNPQATLHVNGTIITNGIVYAENSEVILVTFLGYATSYPDVPRFSTVLVNTGSDLTYATSSTQGTSITVNTTGRYYVSFWATANYAQNQGITVSIGKNVTTFPASTSVNFLASNQNYTHVSYVQALANAVVYLQAGDIVRPFGGGAAGGSRFEIRRVT